MKETYKLYISLQVILLFVLPTKQDIPVHCLDKDILGNWKITLSDFSEQNFCNFKFPPSKHSYIDMYKLNNENAMSFYVNLSDDHKISQITENSSYQKIKEFLDEYCKKFDVCDENVWTLIYDEGFNFRLKGFNFFGFFQFKVLPRSVQRTDFNFPQKNIDKQPGGNQTQVNCGKSLVGFVKTVYHKKDKTGCFLMEKVDYETVKIVIHEETLLKTVINVSSRMSDLQSSSNTQLNQPTVNNHETAIKIKSKSSVNLYSSVDLKSYPNDQQDLASDTPWSLYVSKNQKYNTEPNCKDKGLPCSVDWDEFQTKSENQGQDGACYIFATKHMLLSRALIKLPHLKSKLQKNEIFSVPHLANCAYTTQGLKGGFSNEVSLWLKYNSSMSENCWNKYHDCSKKCSEDEIVVNTKDYGDVGGYYGASNEFNMMKELQEGPIAINLEATPYSFNDISSLRVYDPSDKWNKNYVSNKNFKDNWARVVHSILIYGYGYNVDTKEKYWRVQNSWGEGWGHDGKARVLRGKNVMGIESYALWATPGVVGAE